jgi:predicted metal-binding protein
MEDSIEYELVNWEARECWKCQGECGRYRHRKTIKGAMPAICCGVAAKLITKYEQPVAFTVEQPLERAAQSPESA